MSKRDIKIAVVLVLSVLISLTFLFYSFIKVKELESVQVELDQANQLIQDLNSKVTIQEERAIEAAAEALKQKKLTEKALLDCQTK